MLTQRFRTLTQAEPPFVSVYIDDSRDTADAEGDLDARWRALRAELERECCDERVIAEVARAILHSTAPVGRRGRGVIATAAGVLINEHTTTPPPSTVLRISDYPYFLPLVNDAHTRTYIFAAVDHAGADISVHTGDVVWSESLDAPRSAIHKPASAGWNGYGDLQHTVDEAVRTNVRAIADRLIGLVDRTDPEVVFVCGESRSRSDVLSELPRRAMRRVATLPAGAYGRRIDEQEARDRLDAELERRRVAETADILDSYVRERARLSGLAVEGLDSVCAALREGCVDTLIIGDLADTTVVTGQSRTVIAPDADTLSSLGQPARRVARADEALPFVAITTDASIVDAGGALTARQGIAALLRYAPDDM